MSEHKQDLTPDELLQFDGKEGRPAYVGYQGAIYDVTGSKLWPAGAHMRKHLAGADMTEALKTAPHADDRILRMPVVGKLVTGEGAKREGKPRFFYFLAYMNLALVFLIIFVISLWRWW